MVALRCAILCQIISACEGVTAMAVECRAAAFAHGNLSWSKQAVGVVDAAVVIAHKAAVAVCVCA